MAYIYPLNNPGGVHLTVFDFTHLSPPPNLSEVVLQSKNMSIIPVSAYKGYLNINNLKIWENKQNLDSRYKCCTLTLSMYKLNTVTTLVSWSSSLTNGRGQVHCTLRSTTQSQIRYRTVTVHKQYMYINPTVQEQYWLVHYRYSKVKSTIRDTSAKRN